MSSPATTVETVSLENMEFAPKCETVLYHTVTGKETRCDKPATHVLIFHTAKGCFVKTELNCAECVDYCKKLRCHCGEDQYINSMPIKQEK